MTPEILLEALDEGGYRREDPVTGPGQIARRGFILDVFPSDQDAPVRLEFLGDTLESLRVFDPETQRTVRPMEALTLLPLSDVFPTRTTLSVLRARLKERFGETPATRAFLESLDRGLLPDETVELLPSSPGPPPHPTSTSRAPWPWFSTPRRSGPRPWPSWSAPTKTGSVASRAGAAACPCRPRKPSFPESPSLPPQDDHTLLLRDLDPEARGLALGARPVPRYAGDVDASPSISGAPRPPPPAPFSFSATRVARSACVTCCGKAAFGWARTSRWRPACSPSPRASRCRRSACACWPTATSSRRRCISTRAVAGARRASSPTSATSDRRPRGARGARDRPLRGARDPGPGRGPARVMVLSYQGGTGSRCPSTPSTASRSTRAPSTRGPPSTGWAAGAGTRSRSGSRRPCGTWRPSS